MLQTTLIVSSVVLWGLWCWRNCDSGDNINRMRYYIRYLYDQDDDGHTVDQDYDDLDPMVGFDYDNDGLNFDVDCDDQDFENSSGDCDGDGLPSWDDCDDSNPAFGENDGDCDNDGIDVDSDCDDRNSDIHNTGFSGKSEACAGTDCLSILKWGIQQRWHVLDSSL